MKPAAQLTPEELFNLLAGIIKPVTEKSLPKKRKIKK
jgi:hypothetical protein